MISHASEAIFLFCYFNRSFTFFSWSSLMVVVDDTNVNPLPSLRLLGSNSGSSLFEPVSSPIIPLARTGSCHLISAWLHAIRSPAQRSSLPLPYLSIDNYSPPWHSRQDDEMMWPISVYLPGYASRYVSSRKLMECFDTLHRQVALCRRS